MESWNFPKLKHCHQEGNVCGFLNSRAILIHTTTLYSCKLIKLLTLPVFETNQCHAIWCKVLEKIHRLSERTHMFTKIPDNSTKQTQTEVTPQSIASVSSFIIENLKEKYTEYADIQQIKSHDKSLSQPTDSVTK
jgi:hypothetical protein